MTKFLIAIMLTLSTYCAIIYAMPPHIQKVAQDWWELTILLVIAGWSLWLFTHKR